MVSGAEAFETNFSYDADGCLDYAELRSNGTEYLKSDYSTNASGKVVNIDDFDSDGAALESVFILYDENGNLSELTSSSSNSTISKKFLYTPTSRVTENAIKRIQKLNFTTLEFN